MTLNAVGPAAGVLGLGAVGASDVGLLQLEVEELLSHTRVKYSKEQQKAIKAYLKALRTALAAIPQHDVDADLVADFVRGLGLPDVAQPAMAFHPPASVTLVGSFATQTAARPNTVVDVAVEMPAACFFRKAHLNHRYHIRRAMYLAVVSRHLSLQPLFANQHVGFLHDDPRKPVLLLDPPTTTSDASAPGGATAHSGCYGLRVRLLLSIHPTVFQVSKLGPASNSLRSVCKSAPSHQQPSKASAQQTPIGAAVAEAASMGHGVAATTSVASNGTVKAVATPSSASAGGATAAAVPAAAAATAAAIADAAAAEEAQLLPTPMYNASVSEDAAFAVHVGLMQAALQRVPQMADGCILLKVWSRQYGLSQHSDGASGFLLSMLLAHLVLTGKVTAVMTPLQMMSATLKALSDPLTLRKGVKMDAAAVSATPAPATGVSTGIDSAATAPAAADAWPAPSSSQLSAFKQHHTAVLLDSTGWINLAAHLTEGSLAQAQLCATRTLALLDRPADPDEAFAATFLRRDGASCFAASYDYVWRIDLPMDGEAPPAASSGQDVAGGTGKRKAGQAVAGDRRGGADAPGGFCLQDRNSWREQELRVESLMRTALSDRALVIRACPRALAMHPVPPADSASASSAAAAGGTVPAPSLGCRTILVGARVDAEQASRLVDVGPAADDAKRAKRYREFWGPKSELRRFKDGKISEALVWECGIAERHTLPDRIVEYALSRHLSSGTRISGSSGVLDSVFDRMQQQPSHAGRRHFDHGTSGSTNSEASVRLTAYRLAEAALEHLSKLLRNLNKLALKVTSVQPLSAAIRGTVAFPPLPHPLAGGPLEATADLPRCLEAIPVMVQLEGSGRWPDDPAALHKTKAALSLQLGEALQEASPGLAVVATENCLDVLLEGFAFRILLHSGREQVVAAAGIPASDTSSAAAAAAAVSSSAPSSASVATGEAALLQRSWHHGSVSAVLATNAAFAPACRLAHRWLAAHLLSNHVCHEAMELLLMAAFTAPLGLPPPASRMTGFLRFLQLLSQHPWNERPLVVDPQKELNEAARRALQRRWEVQRAAGHAPALYISTPRDLDSTTWTKSRPSGLVLQHLVLLAADSARHVEALLEGGDGAAPHSSSGSSRAGSASVAATSCLYGLPLAAASSAGGARRRAPWVGLFSPRLDDFDVLITLRPESIPLADYAVTSGASELHAGRDALSRLLDDLDAGEDEPPRKRARAVIGLLPQQLLASRGRDKLLPELLIGFDPVAELLQLLEGRYGHLASFCADGLGGRVVGVKWHAAAFLAAPLRMAAAHTTLVCSVTQHSAQAPAPAPGIGLAVPNIIQVLSEFRSVGEGMVEDVVVCGSGSHL